MKSFKNRDGVEWLIDVNVHSVTMVRDLLGIDLLRLEGKELVEELIADPIKLVNVIYVICKQQADDRGTTDVQFGRAMAGDAIDHATTALLEDFVDFSRAASVRSC